MRKKIKKKIKESQKKTIFGRESEGERERRKVEKEISLSNLRKSDLMFSSEQKAKSVHASRATRGYKNLGVSSNSKR